MVFFLAFLEMIARMVAEARRLGYSESSIWTNIQPGLRAFAIYYGKKGIFKALRIQALSISTCFP